MTNKLKNNEEYNSNSTLTLPESNYFINRDAYLKAQHKANWYLRELDSLSKSDHTFTQLHKDYKQWQRRNQLKSAIGLSQLEEQHDKKKIDSLTYIERIAAEKKLKNYLHKSFSYIFLRDLGKSLNDPLTQSKVNSLVVRFEKYYQKRLKDKSYTLDKEEQAFDLTFLHQKAKLYNVEPTLYWLMRKLQYIQSNLPDSLDKANGMRKLVKIIAGVVMHKLVDMPKKLSQSQQRDMVDGAIRLGYCYGITYPLIDDLQDSKTALSSEDKNLFNLSIRKSLLAGKVCEFPSFSEDAAQFMTFVYSELAEAFNTIRTFHNKQTAKTFFEQAFVFFEAQDIDRLRKNDQKYTMEELFAPIILKAAGCRLIAKEVVSVNQDQAFDYRTFCFGIYNQFNDDIKDIFDDQAESNVTPYTYYLKHCDSLSNNKELQNPYQLYWSVVHYLIYTVFDGDKVTKQLLLERTINAHKSLKNQIGLEKYKHLRAKLLFTNNIQFDMFIDHLVEQPNDIAWFDKLLSRQIGDFFTNNDCKKEAFSKLYKNTKSYIEKQLFIKNPHPKKPNPLVDAANYSLKAGGKRLRPVLAYWWASEKYNLPDSAIKPVIRLLEYMHTASLILDDLPCQDNADSRRGKPSLHKHLKSPAAAELTAVMMMMKAVEEQANIQGPNSLATLESIQYAASTTQAICKGQWLDIESKDRYTTPKQLEIICHLKTGLAIEAAFMIPAILAQANDIEREVIKKFSYHLGLAFQIKDDILDYCSNAKDLGKPVVQDSSKASFVTVLGLDDAYNELYQHYFACFELLSTFKPIEERLKMVLDFVIHRDC